MPCHFSGRSGRMFFLLFSFVLVLVPRSIHAQAVQRSPAPATTVSGVVVDPQGGLLPRVHVRLIDAQQHEVRATLTDAAGRFAIDASACSGCRVEASLAGFTAASSAVTASPLRLELALAPVREAIVVSATRDAAPASQVGATVTVIDGDDIERRGLPLVSTVLRNVPGVTVVGTGGLGGVTSVFVRGGESSYNKVLLDGIPLNEPGGTFNFNNLTTLNLDRIEVVRGAQSALFGSDAMSSVIQLVTKRGRPGGRQPHGAFIAEGGGYGTTRIGGAVSGAAERWDYSLEAGRFETDNSVPNNHFENTTLSWAGGGLISTGISLRAVGRFERAHAGTPGQTAFGRPDRDAFFDRHDAVAGVTLQQTRATFKGRLTYAYSKSDQVSTNLVADPPYTPAFDGRVGQFEFADFLYDSDNVLRRHHLGYQADWTLGGWRSFAARQFVTAAIDWDGERAVLNNRRSALRVPASRNNTGVTLQYQAVSGRFALAAGGRIEDNASFGTVGVPRISTSAVLYRGGAAIGTTSIKFNAGKGVKEPTVLQSFSPSTSFLGNPDLRPERARTVDIGIEQRLMSDRARVEIVWFDNRYRDQISTRTISFSPYVSQYFNIGLTTARGMELAVDTAPVPGARVSGGYTLTASRIVESTSPFSPVFAAGEWAFRRPRHSGFLQLTVGKKAIAVDLTGTFAGRRVDSDFVLLVPPITSAPGYATWTLGGHYRPASHIDVFVRIENLTDANYMEPLGYLAWRRTGHAGVRLGF